jgi:hypothetical protein
VKDLTVFEKVYVMSTVFDTVETLKIEEREDEADTLIELLEIVQNLGEIAEA